MNDWDYEFDDFTWDNDLRKSKLQSYTEDDEKWNAKDKLKRGIKLGIFIIFLCTSVLFLFHNFNTFIFLPIWTFIALGILIIIISVLIFIIPRRPDKSDFNF